MTKPVQMQYTKLELDKLKSQTLAKELRLIAVDPLNPLKEEFRQILLRSAERVEKRIKSGART